MNLKSWIEIVGAAVFSLISINTYAANPGESIVLDPNSGNYIITYCGTPVIGAKRTCTLKQVIFEPATKINPKFKSLFGGNPKGPIAFRYAVKNRVMSAQPIATLALDPVSSIISAQPAVTSMASVNVAPMPSLVAAGQAALTTPVNWGGFQSLSPSGSGLRIGWTYGTALTPPGLAPGVRQLGFGLSSYDLPGIIAAQLTGDPSNSLGFVDEGPDGDIADQVQALQAQDFVTRLAAAPKILVPAPFDRAELLRRIDAEAKSWVTLGILDPIVFAQIDNFIQAAIAAINQGNISACGTNVANVRARLRQIYASLDEVLDDWTETIDSPLISKLAARVLDFDLDYTIRHP
jgi:hypothetical protein